MKDTFLGFSPAATNNKIRAINSGKAKLSIAVLGSSSVGKTALTVRYLTGRFIGDYCSGLDMTYRTSVPHLGGSISTPVDILDTSNSALNVHIEEDHAYPITRSTSSKSEKISHSQAYLVVYALTNAASFDLAKEILSILPSSAPKFLAANQLDLQHRRQVFREEGQALADSFDRCHFGEFSAADPLTDPQNSRHIKSAFGKLIRQLIFSSLAPYCPRIFSKLLGTLAVVKERRKKRRMVTRSTGFGGSIGSDSTSSSCSSISGSFRSCSPVQHDIDNLALSSTSSLILSDDGLMLPLVGRRQQITFPISILLHHLHLSKGVLNEGFSSSYLPTDLMTLTV